MTGRRIAIVAVAAALAAPAAAWGGGFATVGLSSLPDGTAPGEPWVVELTILQHGRTALDGVRPSITISRAAGGGAKRTFPATATGRSGVYRARVVFPSAGTWRYVVDDGFTQRHTFAPVRIGADRGVAAAPQGRIAADGGDGPLLELGVASLAGALAAGLLQVALRRRAGGPTAEAP